MPDAVVGRGLSRYPRVSRYCSGLPGCLWVARRRDPASEDQRPWWNAAHLTEPRVCARLPLGGTSVRTGDEPRLDWTALLRRRPVRIVEGEPRGGYTDLYEIICCDCGDHPYLDYREVSPQLQAIRGPFPAAAGVAAYERHVQLHLADRPFPAETSNGDGHTSQDRQASRGGGRVGGVHRDLTG